MSADRSRVLRLFAPHPAARKILISAGVIPGLMLVCITMLVLSVGESRSEMSNSDAFLFMLGVFVLPLAAILLAAAALREPHFPPRALMWSAAAILVILAGMVVGILMFQDMELERASTLTFFLMFVSPIALLISLPAMYSTARAVPEVRAALTSATSERALAFINARQALSLADLSTLAGIPLDEADNVVDDLLRSGKLAGTLDASSGWIFSAAYLAEKQRALLGWVDLRGNVRIEELAELLKASPAAVTDWLYQLAQRGQFKGYINWRRRVIYSSAGQKISVHSQCPSCGGRLAPGGGQRIVCLHCGTEICDQGEA